MIGAPRFGLPKSCGVWRVRVAPLAIHGPRCNGTLLTNDGLCIVEDGAKRGSATASIRCGCATGPFFAPGNTVASSLPSLFSGSACKNSIGVGSQIRAIKTKSSAKKEIFKT